MKCIYKHCLCETKDIPVGEEVKKGNRYYHQKCAKTQEDVQEIKTLFVEKINKNVVYSQLLSVINNIIFNKHNDSSYLLFGLKYYIKNKINLNYPQGLYYVIQNKDVQNAWNKLQDKNIKSNFKVEYQVEDNNFTYKSTKQKSFSDILRG